MAAPRKAETVARLRAQLDSLVSERDCVATLVPGTDVILMACTPRRCPRCIRLRAEGAENAGWRERLREEYEAAQPPRAPRAVVETKDAPW